MRIIKLSEELLPGFFKLNIPLPKSPLKYLNSYIVMGSPRFLIIDTGFNRPECLNPFLKEISDLKLDLDKADFFITHMHSDHIGMLGNLIRPNSTVFFNKIEIPLVDPAGRETSRKTRHDFFLASGYPVNEFKAALENNPAMLYCLRTKIDFSPLKQNDLLEYGDYSFKCIETPGHSPGQMCLYETLKKMLICGDHILNDITPNIAWWPEMENPLDLYFKSLNKVDRLETLWVLPGHRAITRDHHQRIKEILQHHQNRLDEVIAALKDGEKNAFQIASRLSWDIKYTKWEDFPAGQKYFAVGEALAHIQYLKFEGRIKRVTRDNQYYYTLS
jgi:glyoxylase-like metal-dependent hydrolase (beta-lactamase superfamily II)